MKVLLIKTSSMGDVIHTFPALTDMLRHCPNLQLDWVVEEQFAALAGLHPAVHHVIPVAIRRWRRSLLNKNTYLEGLAFFRQLRVTRYDVIIDAQGLFKSIAIAVLAKGPCVGYALGFAREKWVSFFYRRRVPVGWGHHAVDRIRRLTSAALTYPLPLSVPDYGLDRQRWQIPGSDYVLFFHGTTWNNKQWPMAYWISLAKQLAAIGVLVKLSWGTPQEKEHSQLIAQACDRAQVLDALSIYDLLPVIASAKAVVGVDTGLCHLATALNVPTIALYGPTDAKKTGVMGGQQISLAADFSCAPCLRRKCRYEGAAIVWPACFSRLTPEIVFRALSQMISLEPTAKSNS